MDTRRSGKFTQILFCETSGRIPDVQAPVLLFRKDYGSSGSDPSADQSEAGSGESFRMAGEGGNAD